jgi:hypothetical protein
VAHGHQPGYHRDVLALALAATVAALPQDTVVDRPVFTDADFAVSLPRPDDDWVFVPAAERGTLTVIFHPRNAPLSDQRWGALVLSRWGGPVLLDDIADRRLESTWRPAYGRSFTLLARDSLSVAGLPAIHIVMGGAIAGAVVDVEEYLVARDSDLAVLQFRLPRGEPRDTMAAGYLRVVNGLDLRWGRAPAAAATGAPRPVVPVAHADEGALVMELPKSLMVVAPGILTSQSVSGGRRLVRWTKDAAGQPDSLAQVGRYIRDDVQLGRLRVSVWRLPPDDSAARVTPALIADVARSWAACWELLGPVPRATVTLVETNRVRTTGATGILLVGRDAERAVITREIARTWWGGYVSPDPANPTFVREWLPAWSAWLMHGESGADGGLAAEGLQQVRALVGDARLREALRTLATEGRDAASPAVFRSFLSIPAPALEGVLP